MENNYKKFKAYDRVLIKDGDGIWQIDFYSYKNSHDLHHVMTYGESNSFADEDILPYEGNENLVGTTDEPDEEIRLEEGELIFVRNDIDEDIVVWGFTRFAQVYDSKTFKTEYGNTFKFAIRFKDFDPSNMEETKKNTLCVKNGKIVKYKN